VGHSLGGAQAQLAAVEIATKYEAKVRVITFESILAFTPEGADGVVKDLMCGGDQAEPTTEFPADPCRITAQRCCPHVSPRSHLDCRFVDADSAYYRWVEDNSLATAAPLIYPAGACCPLPFLCPFNFCSASYWKNKYRLVGCWPFNCNLGRGYISKALVMSGYQAGLFGGPPSWGPFGCCRKGGGLVFKKYKDEWFELHVKKREYVAKGARQLSCVCNFPCVVASGFNHLQPFLHWMLYKGAYQNEDAPNSSPPRSQYVPKVVKKANNPCPPSQ